MLPLGRPLRYGTYVAWVHGPKKGRANPIALHTTGPGSYERTGTVLVKRIARLIVTAEVSAMVHAPVEPVWGVVEGEPK